MPHVHHCPLCRLLVAATFTLAAASVLLAQTGQSKKQGADAKPSMADRKSATTAPERPAPQASWFLKTGEAALARAALISGIDLARGTADLRVWSDDQTPCLAAQLNGKSAWVVRSTPASITLNPTTGVQTRELVFNVAMLAETGQLIRLWTDWPEGEPPVWPPCSAKVAAERMAQSGGEVWRGLISPKPRLNFVQVLQGEMASRSGAQIAKQFIAYAVSLDTTIGVSNRAIWSIEERGLPPRPIFGPPGMRRVKAEPNATNHQRHIVFDETGTWWSSTTTPQPDPPPDYVDPSVKPAVHPVGTEKTPSAKPKAPNTK